MILLPRAHIKVIEKFLSLEFFSRQQSLLLRVPLATLEVWGFISTMEAVNVLFKFSYLLVYEWQQALGGVSVYFKLFGAVLCQVSLP